MKNLYASLFVCLCVLSPLPFGWAGDAASDTVEPTVTTPTAITFVDPLTSAEQEGRRTRVERGEWIIADGVATAVSDPELFKKFNRHGPAIQWPRDYRGGTIEFEMKPEDCQRVTFTLNGEGHIFRVTLTDPRPDTSYGPPASKTRIIAWETRSSKQNKGDQFKPDGLPKLPQLNGQWTKVRLEIDDDHGVLTIGDFQYELTHAALARPKSVTDLTFGYGRLSVRNVSLTVHD